MEKKFNLNNPNFYDIAELKTGIEFAKKISKDEDEPYKSLIFQIIFSDFIYKINNSQTKSPTENSVSKNNPPDNNLETSIIPDNKKLAEECGLSVKQINDVISMKKNLLQVIAPLTGTEPEKQIIASSCILLYYEKVLDKEWITAQDLIKCLDISNIGGLKNLARNLGNKTDIFRTRGKRPYKEYKLFGPGRNFAIENFKTLSMGETT